MGVGRAGLEGADADVWQSSLARRQPAMVYDSARGKVVLFGGTIGGFSGLQDTWEWDGAASVEGVGGAGAPRYWHAMGYDSARQRVVLFGGIDSSSDSCRTSGSGMEPGRSAQAVERAQRAQHGL